LTEVYTSGGVCGLIRRYAKILPSLKRSWLSSVRDVNRLV